MEEHFGHRRGAVCAVESNNVVVLVLNPDTSLESTRAALLRHHIEDKTTDRAQELAADVFEVVVVTAELPTDDEHLLETFGQILHGVNLFQPVQNGIRGGAGPAGLILECSLFDRRGFVIELSEKVPVAGWMESKLVVLFEILDISLDEWMHFLHRCTQRRFFCDKFFDDLT